MVYSNSDNLLQARGLACLRGDLLLFDELELTVRAGEVLQVEGANGAGKTSLLRMLAGLTLPESGEVYWNDRPIRQQRAEYTAALNYIGHQPALKGGLTVSENLQFSCGLTGGADIEMALQRIGIYTQRRQPVHTLSAGQRRRAALARLLIRSAPLWILDEPYTALDITGIGLINDLITEHARRGGIVVMTSHQSIELADLPLRRLRVGA